MRHDNPQIQMSGSGNSGLRQNISWISTGTQAGISLIADEKMYAIKSNNGGNYFYGGANWPTLFNEGNRNGINNMIEIAVPGESGSLRDFKTVGAGGYALYSNGNLYTWGYNDYGWCGLGNTTATFYPSRSLSDVAEVYTHPTNNSGEAWYSRLVIRRNDGKVYGAGYNANYELGLGDTTNRTSFTELTWAGVNPISVWNVGSWGGAIVVQRSDGSLAMSGYNNNGQLGRGNTTQPVAGFVASASTWLNNDTTYRIEEILLNGRYFNGAWVTGYNSMTMLLRNASGTRLVTAGDNAFGRIGDGTTVAKTSPTAPTGTWNNIQQIAQKGGGEGDTYVLKTDGTVWGWGRNQQASLGLGNTTQQNTPVQLQSGVTKIFQGMASTWLYAYQMQSPLLEKADGYYTCGYNGTGESGTGLASTPISTWTRVDLPASVRLKMLGETCTTNQAMSRYAVTTDDQIWAWGYNGHGQIEPTTANAWQPIRFTPGLLQR